MGSGNCPFFRRALDEATLGRCQWRRDEQRARKGGGEMLLKVQWFEHRYTFFIALHVGKKNFVLSLEVNMENN